jgi:hypothetical protein
MHQWSVPLRPTRVLKECTVVSENMIISTFISYCVKLPIRKRWCISMVFGVFSRPTRVTKKIKTFF